jgi:tetratricopeptide (TPR) repeat protein
LSEGYSLREVTRLLGLSRSIICGLIAAGFVTPARGARGEYRFTFHDLVLLRAAQGLAQARLSSARILRSLRRLKAQLPAEVPLAGLRIEAVGDAVVVSSGATQWQPDDGQYVFRFQVGAPAAEVAVIAPARAAPAQSDDACFDEGLRLEKDDADAATRAYRAALDLNPRHREASINLGRLLHAMGRHAQAEAHYREAIASCGPDEILLFNLGVLLEDMHRPDEATVAYRSALEQAPEFADAHYNLALLCQRQGRAQEALRHLSAYRRLTTRRK